MKPQTIFCVRGRRAVVVEWFSRKPCWVGARGRDLISGSNSRSRTLAAGQRREIGLCPGPELAGFPGLRRGMMIANFQMAGISALL